MALTDHATFEMTSNLLTTPTPSAQQPLLQTPSTTEPTPETPVRRKRYVMVDAGRILFLIIMSLFILFMFCFHLNAFWQISDFKAKSSDRKMPLYFATGFVTTSIGAIGYGRPYSSFVVACVGLFGLILIAPLLPGMFDWWDKFSLICSSIALLAEYWINVIKSGKWRLFDRN